MRRVIFAAMLVAACAPRGDFTAAPADRGSATPTAIFVGTTRVAGEDGFSRDRADVASFLRYDISIPAEREAGTVNWPRRSQKPDADKHFLTLNETRFAEPVAFRGALRDAMALRGQAVAVVYVHGFNNTMAEGVYRVAQMHHDLKVPGVAIHYAWPSRGSALGYVYDRDSALFGRGGFEDLLDEVAASGAREIVIVAHSMGSALSMETLRQMALRGNSRALSRIKGVVLISPDLDVDLFRSIALDIGTLPQPFVIFGSSKDRILNLSATISGAPERLGNLEDLTKIQDLKVTYIDTAAYDVGAGHFNLGTNPTLISLFSGIIGIDAALRADERSRVGLFQGLVLTVRNATEIVLAPVGAIGEVQAD
ncbi:alpha/beta fold hydrolase [Tabrizicola piscis]|uniref:Alpha/beta fold hydrolase n=1 Tax=Tabrizicola piscis TaxID=2494374 RepID=A0A3S8U6X9_9RHOB|nr:alpha/beta fold hydrolase [Tabrizicola piscis]AZL59280.1 alpha/beta fold hydrolase [Tabrizicola piscis]